MWSSDHLCSNSPLAITPTCLDIEDDEDDNTIAKCMIIFHVMIEILESSNNGVTGGSVRDASFRSAN